MDHLELFVRGARYLFAVGPSTTYRSDPLLTMRLHLCLLLLLLQCLRPTKGGLTAIEVAYWHWLWLKSGTMGAEPLLMEVLQSHEVYFLAFDRGGFLLTTSLALLGGVLLVSHCEGGLLAQLRWQLPLANLLLWVHRCVAWHGLEGTLGSWRWDEASLPSTFLLHDEVAVVELHFKDGERQSFARSCTLHCRLVLAF